jgi:membrane-associated protease RseP (regulator of RpoE activity)
MNRRTWFVLGAVVILAGACLAAAKMFVPRDEGDTIPKERGDPAFKDVAAQPVAPDVVAEATETLTVAEPTERVAAAQPAEVGASAEPAEMRPAAQPAETPPPAEPADAAGVAEPAEAAAVGGPVEARPAAPSETKAAAHPAETGAVGKPEKTETAAQPPETAGGVERPETAAAPRARSGFEHVVVTLELPALDEPLIWAGEGHGPNCAMTKVSSVLGIAIGQPHGITVARVIPNGPAAEAGILAGDGIVQCGEAKVTCPASLLPYLKRGQEPKSLTLTVRRPARRGVPANAGHPGSP